MRIYTRPKIRNCSSMKNIIAYLEIYYHYILAYSWNITTLLQT